MESVLDDENGWPGVERKVELKDVEYLLNVEEPREVVEDEVMVEKLEKLKNGVEDEVMVEKKLKDVEELMIVEENLNGAEDEVMVEKKLKDVE